MARKIFITMRKKRISLKITSSGGQIENPRGTIPFRPPQNLVLTLLWPFPFFFFPLFSNTWLHPQISVLFQIVLFIVWPWKSIVGQWRIHVTVHRIVKKKKWLSGSSFSFPRTFQVVCQIWNLRYSRDLHRVKILRKVNALQLNPCLFDLVKFTHIASILSVLGNAFIRYRDDIYVVCYKENNISTSFTR